MLIEQILVFEQVVISVDSYFKTITLKKFNFVKMKKVSGFSSYYPISNNLLLGSIYM